MSNIVKFIKFKSKILVFSILSLILVVLSYCLIDKKIAYFSHDFKTIHLRAYQLFHLMQNISDLVSFCICILAIYVFSIMIFFSKNTSFYKKNRNRILQICPFIISYFVARFFVKILKFVFGRYWPETWINNNLSLIHDNIYGLTFFNSNSGYQSFPSGHSAVIFSVATIFWILYPKLRWLSIVSVFLVILGLLGCNYHFLSDILAGAYIGIIAGYISLFIVVKNYQRFI